MKFYHPIEDQVSETPNEWSIPLWEEPHHSESRALVPGTCYQHSWDSVSLGALKRCPRYYKFTILDGWRLHPTPVALQFGIYFHLCMETRHRLLAHGFDQPTMLRRVARLALLLGESLQPGRPERTKETLCRAVVWYCFHFEDDAAHVTLRPNGEPTVEYSFTIPLANADGPFTINGHQIYLCGHLDNYMEFLGHYYVGDYKSTKGGLSTEFFDEFKTSYQQKGYFAAAHALSAVPTSAIPAPPKGCIIDAVELQVNANRFARHIVTWTALEMEDYLTDMEMTIRTAWFYAAHNRWPANETACVGRYGKCEFYNVCTATPPARQRILESNFVRSTWDPRKAR